MWLELFSMQLIFAFLQKHKIKAFPFDSDVCVDDVVLM